MWYRPIRWRWRRCLSRRPRSRVRVSGSPGWTAEIQRGLSLWTLLTVVEPGTQQWTAMATESTVNYYCLRAIDSAGLQSDWTQVIDDSVDRNHFFLADDNVSRVQLPDSGAAVLRREHNTYGSD